MEQPTPDLLDHSPNASPEHFKPLERVGEEIAAIQVRLDAATHRLLTLIRQFDEEGGWCAQGALSMAHWLTWRTQMGASAAREKVRVARALEKLPKVDEALRRAEISYSQARAITRVADHDTEEFLLTIAREGTAAQLEKLCRKYRSYTDMLDKQERFRAAWLDLDVVHGNGVRHLELAGPREKIDRVVEALDRVAELIDVADADDPPLTEATALQVGPKVDDQIDWHRRLRENSRGFQRAQALVALSEMVLHGALPRISRPAHEVIVQVEAEVLAGTKEGIGTQQDGSPVFFERLRRICCDGPIVPVVVQGSDVLDVGRRTRAIPPAIRRALQVRDGCCRFPGCGTHFYLDGHHIQHWAAGGETKLDNLVELCWQHHTLVHEGGFRAEGTGDDLRFYTPDGNLIPQRPRRAPLDPAALEKWVGHEALAAEMRTRYPRWDGTPAEYHYLVGFMLDDQVEGRKRRAAEAMRTNDIASSLPN